MPRHEIHAAKQPAQIAFQAGSGALAFHGQTLSGNQTVLPACLANRKQLKTGTDYAGGTAVEPKTIAPDEIRGKEIEVGESRRIGQGDVIVIPNGVPH